MESAFNNIVWDVRTQNIQFLENINGETKIVPLNTDNYHQLSIPLNYNLPLHLYFETFIPQYSIHHSSYDIPNMTPYYILGAISTFYNSIDPLSTTPNQTYMNMLGNNIWFRGLVKYRDGYRVILDSVSHIQVVNMQGVGLKPIVRPNVPLKQPQIIPIPSTKIKQPQIIPMPNVEIKPLFLEW